MYTILHTLVTKHMSIISKTCHIKHSQHIATKAIIFFAQVWFQN